MGFRSLGRRFRVDYLVLYEITPPACSTLARLFLHPLAVSVTSLAWVNVSDRIQAQAHDRSQLAPLEHARPAFRFGCLFRSGIATQTLLIHRPQLGAEGRADGLVGKRIADMRAAAVRAKRSFLAHA